MCVTLHTLPLLTHTAHERVVTCVVPYREGESHRPHATPESRAPPSHSRTHTWIRPQVWLQVNVHRRDVHELTDEQLDHQVAIVGAAPPVILRIVLVMHRPCKRREEQQLTIGCEL